MYLVVSIQYWSILERLAVAGMIFKNSRYILSFKFTESIYKY